MKTILFTLLACVHVCFGQNLVPNPSFEQYNTCPPGTNGIDLAIPWFQPRFFPAGSSDYYNICSSQVGVPDNWIGYQHARSGGGYAGISPAYQMPSPQFAEYIEVRLTQPLSGEKKYIVSFYVSFANKSMYGIDAIGAYFSKTVINATDYKILTQYQPQMENTKGLVLQDTLNWMLVSGTFMAEGGEEYMIIGNFNDSTITVQTNNWGIADFAYYYIDDVSVIEDTTTSINDEQSTTNKIHLYPNPFKNILNINAPSKDTQSLTIANELGETVYQSKLTSNEQTLDLSFLSKGIYFVSLLSKESVYKKKILKIE